MDDYDEFVEACVTKLRGRGVSEEAIDNYRLYMESQKLEKERSMTDAGRHRAIAASQW